MTTTPHAAGGHLPALVGRLLALAALAALAAAPAAAARPFDCGPFLLQPGPTTMTVVVDDAEPVAASLRWRGLDGGGKGSLRHDPAKHHVFHLTGLEPGRRYRYRLEGPGRDSGEHVLRTLPQAPDRYRFLAVGDVRSQPQVWRALAQRIHDEEPEALFAVGTGDYPADGRQYRQWIEQFFDPARQLLASLPLWPAIGNHEHTRQYVAAPPPDEMVAAEASQYFDLFELPGNERWYRVNYRYLTLLVLDSNSQMAPGHDQYEWVREQLRSPRGRFTVVAFHHDPVTSGPHGRRKADGTFREWPLDQARRFLMPLFEMYGVDLVLNGHDHIYERSRVGGVTYVVTGGGGAPLYELDRAPNPYRQAARAAYHYAAVDVAPTSLTLTAIGLDGEILDWFVLPVTEASAARLGRQWRDALLSGLSFAAEGGKQVRARVRNVLDFPVRVSLQAEEEVTGAPVAPSAVAELELPVGVPPARLQAPSWRGRVAARVDIALRGDGDGIPLHARLERQVVVREASYVAPRMAPPTVDGDLRDWPEGEGMWIDRQSATVVNPDAYHGDADLRARVRVGWSPAGLHLAFDVDDEEVMDHDGAAAWQVDGVELYLDGRPEDRRPDAYGEGVSQNVLPALRPGSTPEGNRAWRQPGAFDWQARRRPGGYVVEVTIPGQRIRSGWTPAAGDSVRFDAMVNDLDGDGRSHHRLWSTGGASSSTAGYGLLILGP